jgi:predicted small secreted protein
MRKIVVMAAAAACMFVAGCNTVAGAGKDVSAAGTAVSETAQDAKN